MRNANVLSMLRRRPPHQGDRGHAADLVHQHFLLQDERPAAVGEVESLGSTPSCAACSSPTGPVDPGARAADAGPGRGRADQPGGVAIQPRSRAPRSRGGGGRDPPPGADRDRRRAVALGRVHIVPSGLPPGFMSLLEGAPDGIGQSLQRVALESSRELLWFGRERCPPGPAPRPGPRSSASVPDRQRPPPGDPDPESFAVGDRAGTIGLAGLDGRRAGEGPSERRTRDRPRHPEQIPAQGHRRPPRGPPPDRGARAALRRADRDRRHGLPLPRRRPSPEGLWELVADGQRRDRGVPRRPRLGPRAPLRPRP